MLIIPAPFLTAPPTLTTASPVWIPDAVLRARVAGIAPADIKTLRFRGRMMGALRAEDELTVSDPAVCARFLQCLQKAERPRDRAGLPGIATNHAVVVEFEATASSGTTLILGFNPTDPAFCFGPTLYRFFGEVLPEYQAAEIRKASRQASSRGVVGVTFGMLTQQKITDAAEVTRLLGALRSADGRTFACTGRATSGEETTGRVLPSRVLLHLKDKGTLRVLLAVSPVPAAAEKSAATDALRLLRRYAEETEPEL